MTDEQKAEAATQAYYDAITDAIVDVGIKPDFRALTSALAHVTGEAITALSHDEKERFIDHFMGYVTQIANSPELTEH